MATFVKKIVNKKLKKSPSPAALVVDKGREEEKYALNLELGRKCTFLVAISRLGEFLNVNN